MKKILSNKIIFFSIFFFISCVSVNATPYNNIMGDTLYLSHFESLSDSKIPAEFGINSGIFLKLIIFLILFSAITFALTFFSNENKILIKSIFNKKISYQLYESQSPVLNSLMFFYNIISLLAVGLLLVITKENLYETLKINNIIVFFIPLIFYIVQIVFLKIFDIVFEMGELNRIFRQTNSINGIIIFPLLVLIFFIIYFFSKLTLLSIVVSLIVLLLFYIIRTYNLLGFFLTKGFSKLLLFLYLCSIEILPVLIFVKIILYKS